MIAPADTVSGVESLSPSQLRFRSRVEAVISLASPFLDAVLAAGDRISRIAEPRDYEYYPVRQDEADDITELAGLNGLYRDGVRESGA